MRIALVFVMLVVLCRMNAQNNIYATFGINATVGAPSYAPGPRGSIVAIDTVTGFWWINTNRSSAAAWVQMGHRLQKRTGCTAPSAAPGKYESWFVVNTCAAPKLYLWDGTSDWDCLNCSSGGGGGAIETDATLSGDGSSGDPLTIAQQGAQTGQGLEWTGATWEPSWGNPHIFVTTGSTITSDINEILIGTTGANTTFGLPTCNAGLDGKRFVFVKNGDDGFSVTIDPAGSQEFYGALTKKIFWGPLAIKCTCHGATGTWFSEN